MTTPIARGSEFSLPAAPQSTAEIRIGRESTPLAGLTPGAALEVTVRRDPQLGNGVVINGKFLAATLPDTVADGQTLAVRVLPAGDAVVLKVIDPSRLFGDRLVAQTFEQILKNLLPELSFSDLRQGVAAFQEQVPSEVLKVFVDGILGKNNSTTGIDPKLLSTFEKLLRSSAFLTENSTQDATTLQQSLMKILKGSAQPEIQNARKVLDGIMQQSPPNSLVRFTKTLEEHLMTLLQKKTSLDFKSAGDAGEKVLSQQLRIYLLASQSAVESGNSNALQLISKDMAAVRRMENPLSLILGVLKNIDLPDATDPAPASKLLAGALRSAAHDLQKLKDSSAPEKEVREAVKKIALNLGEARESATIPAKNAALAQQLQGVLKNVENVTAAQQSLNQMNVVMQALGEPSLLLFPTFIQGLFTTMQVAVRNVREQNEEEGNGKKPGGTKGFERVQLSLQLPKLGQIEVDVAHRKEELLMQLTAAGNEPRDAIEKNLPKLEKVFASLGFKKTSITAIAGSPGRVVPSWYTELNKRSIIA